MISANAITFDIDWAPDWTILLCAEICSTRGVPATFFVTHDTPALDELRRMPGIELGVHPNFLARSSHGGTPEEVLDFCMKLVPTARSMRTHSLVQSSHILQMVAERTPIETDVSLLLPFHQGLQATYFHIREDLRPLTRLPYFWEDDVASVWPGWNWTSSQYRADGLMIFDFHPIHIALNTDKMAGYERLKTSMAGRPLSSATRDECAMCGYEIGARTFLERVLQENDRSTFLTISDLGSRFGAAA